MAKVKFNTALQEVRGKVNGWKYTKRGKKHYISPMPGRELNPRKKRKRSLAEKATQSAPREWNSYLRRVDANPELRELSARYRAVSRETGDPVGAIAARDFNHPPVVDAIDARAYRGEAGQLIRVRAHDDFEVRDVTVTIQSGGKLIESGPAVRQIDDTWHYSATAPAAGTVSIAAAACDWPGHKGERRVSVDLSAPPAAAEDSPRARVVEQIRSLAQRRGHFRTRQGEARVNYFDKYRLSHSPVLLRELAAMLLAELPAGTDAIAGLEMGGIPLATMLSQLSGRPLLLLRKEARTWGTEAPAEGGALAARHIVLVADVVTTGHQLAACTRTLRSAGAIVARALCILDQLSGAPAVLQRENVALTSLFTAFELIA